MTREYQAQFWIGAFDSEDAFYEFVSENSEYWSQANDDDSKTPLSHFIKSQGQSWYDHDFMEVGFSNERGSVLGMFQGHSYVEQWSPMVEEQLRTIGLDAANAFIMLGIDNQPNGQRYKQVTAPASVTVAGGDLRYLGELTYSDSDAG